MRGRSYKFILLLLFLLIGIVVVVMAIQTEQQTQSQAGVSTTISLLPTQTQTTVENTIPIDIVLDPGSNLVSFVKLEILYSSHTLEPSSNDPFTVNQLALPSVIEGPIFTNGKIVVVLTAGADATRVITSPTKLGTLLFRAKSATGFIPATITINQANSLVLATDSQTPADTNVLSNTENASVTITNPQTNPTPTPTIFVTPSIGPPTITPTSTPVVSLIPNPTRLSLSLLLQGIWPVGDNQTTQNENSNKNPKHPERSVRVDILRADNTPVAGSPFSTTVSYSTGSWNGNVDLGNLQTGDYKIKIQTDKYLKKLQPGIIRLIGQTQNPARVTTLVVGDVNTDNSLNIIDYNILSDCGYSSLSPLPMTDPSSDFNTQSCERHGLRANADLNDDGTIDGVDYNLFIRNINLQNGD